MLGESSPYAVLAEILVSKKVGLVHVRLVGEVVIAQSRLSQWLFDKGKQRLSADGWVDLTERVLETEERYKDAWIELDTVGSTASRNEELQNLERALRDAGENFNTLHRELNASHT